MNKKIFRLLLPLTLMGVALWVVFQFTLSKARSSDISGSGTIETTEVYVGSKVGGRVLATYSREGQWVQQGDQLVRLDAFQWPAQYEQLQAQLQQSEAQLTELLHGARPQEIAAAEAQAQAAQAQYSLTKAGARSEDIAQAAATRRQAEADMKQAQRNDERLTTLLVRHVISQQEYDQAHTAYLVAHERWQSASQHEAELRAGNRPQEIDRAREEARARWEQAKLLRAGSREEVIAAQRAVVKSIQAQLQQVSIAMQELVVTSPCHCLVSGLDIKPGQLILPNQPLASLTDLEDLWIRVYIPEERFGQVRPGDKAVVKVDAFPEKTFEGQVVQLASRAEFTPRNVQTQETRRMQVFGVKVALENPQHLLRPGMPADVTFRITK